MNTLARGAARGAAYGLATACFEIWFGVAKRIELRMPPAPIDVGEAALLEIALGVVLGAIAAPALMVRRGPLLHALFVALGWLALERAVAPDPTKVAVWLGPPAVGLLLLGAGCAVARRWPRAPWALGIAVLAGTLVVPSVIHRRHVDETRPASAAAPARGADRPLDADSPDVLIVVLDTVRAQNVSAYGYPRPTTPYLERLAGEGTLFLDATAPSTWSLPSHASLFTGRFPSAHGADAEHRFLDADSPTIAEHFASSGYETRCFTANPHISDGFGLTRGFDWSDRAWLASAGGRSFVFVYRVLDLLGISVEDKGGGDVATNFERWARTRTPSSRPAFTFVNFLEAHFPYHQVPRQFLAKFTSRGARELREVSLAVFGAQFGRPLAAAEIAAAAEPSRDMYDAGIAYSDHLLERVVEALRATGTLDETVLVVLADHGEMVGEHGQFGHGAALYEPGIRVPLLIRFPPKVRGGLRMEQPVSTVGVYATVAELAGMATPDGLQVGSLVPALSGKPAGAPVIAERFAFPEASAGGDPLAMRDRRYRVYRSGDHKLVQTSRGETLLFDLRSDPGEIHDVAAERGEDLARLRDELAAWSSTLGLPPIDAPLDFKAAPGLDPAARERLKALGYTD